MKARSVLLFAILMLAAILISCSNDPSNGGGGEPPPEPTLATVHETITAANNLMSDVVSIVAGFGSNAFIQDPGVPTCSTFDCGLESPLLLMAFPAVNAQFYELDEDYNPTNLRLATGTFTWDVDAGSFDYTPAANSLSFSWPHTETGDAMELRVDWQNVTQARTYDHEVEFFLLPSPYGLVDIEMDVPGKALVSFKQGTTELMSLDVTQTLANTACGRLVEYRTVSASGFFSQGSQTVRLDSFDLDHSSDAALAISLAGSVSSGSLSVPFSASADLTAGAVTRDADSCQLNGVEGPLDGSVELWVGSPSTGLGLGFEWAVTFEDNDFMQPAEFTFEGARLGVGEKYVLITGTVEVDELTGALVAENLLLTFLDRVEMPVLEFGELLTFPELP
jgi:hypothetical protein